MDVSNDISSSPTSSSFHRRATHEEDEDLRKQMTGIFLLIDKNNTGYISIAQLEETIRDLVSEGHNADFMEFIQSFGAYMETINALGKDNVDVNKMDLDAFCKCTKNYMMWRRVRQLKRQDSTSFYLNQSQEVPRPNGRFRVSGPLMRVLQSKNLFSGITKQYTSYGDYHGTIGVAEFISAIPNTPERELRMLIGQLDVDREGYYSLDEFFEDVGGLEHVMIGDVMSPNISQIDNTPATPNGAESRPSASAMVRSMSKDLQKSNMELERKCDAFQTEIQFLTVSVSKLENELQKKDKEIERLKRDSKLVGVMQESEKEFQSQVSTLSSQVSKSNTVVEDLRRQFSEERDKAKMLAESLASKEEEVRKLNFTVKFQSTLQDKIAALQQYIHEVEQELEKERDKVMFYKNSALASPRPMERRNSEDRIPLFVRQSSFSASTPPLSVELLTHTMSHPITPAYPMAKLNFTSPSPITSPTHSVNLTPITSVSSSSVSSTPAGATPYAITTPSVAVTSSTPNVLSPSSTIASSSTIVSSSSSSTQTHPLQSTPPVSRSKPNSPIASRHDVPPIPINLSSPPSSPSVKPRSGSKGNVPPLQIPSSNNTITTTTITTNTQSEPIPPPPATPQTTLTQAPTVPNKTSSSISAANAHYARIPPAPLSPQLPSVSVTEPSPSSVSPISHNVFLPSEPAANSGEDPALTSLRIQLWQLSTQLANTERLLAESQSRLESVLAAPRIPDSAWNVLKYFCPTGIFCTTHD